MIHKMNLWNDSFIAIKEGWKTIEMRLNDDKRRKIQTGDIVEFTNISTLEKMSCLVVKIYNYKTFEELYLNHSKVSIGYKEDETAKPEDMLVYYSMEEIKNYGVLGIEIKVL